MKLPQVHLFAAADADGYFETYATEREARDAIQSFRRFPEIHSPPFSVEFLTRTPIRRVYRDGPDYIPQVAREVGRDG